ncbi:MAG: OadG family protein [Christensenellales bacterium]
MIAALSSITDAPPKVIPDTFFEKAIMGGSVTVLGLLIVFTGLVALIFITWLYPKISEKAILFFQRIKDRKKTGGTRASSDVPVSGARSNQYCKTAENDALIAAITAAVALSVGAPSGGIVIKSIKRAKTNITAWSATGALGGYK